LIDQGSDVTSLEVGQLRLSLYGVRFQLENGKVSQFKVLILVQGGGIILVLGEGSK